MISITIQEAIPSLNVTLKEHWSRKSKRKKTYEKQIILALLEKYSYKERQEAQAREPRKVSILSQRARLLDHDNCVGGGKSLIDALRSCKLIVDDNKQWLLDLSYTQSTGKPHNTTITIE